MGNEAHKEPTMEEILASIRKIINDDGGPASAVAPVESIAPVADDIAVEAGDQLEEMTFEPEAAELDSVMFDEGENELTGFEAQEEVDPFNDSDFELSDTSIDTEDLVEMVDLEEVQLPSFDEDDSATEMASSEDEDGPSFEEMLGTLNKVSEEFEAVGGETVHEPEPVAVDEPAAQAMEAPELRTETAPAPETTVQAAPIAEPVAPVAAVASATTADGALEGLVRQLLDPVIREWIDNNLKGLVDETVQGLVEDKVQSLVEQKVDEEVQRNVRLALQKFASGA